MLEVHILPDELGGYRLEHNGAIQWFTVQAHAVAWARELCAGCFVICYAADGSISATYNPLVGDSEMADLQRQSLPATARRSGADSTSTVAGLPSSEVT
jgi:hypothetical protein